MGIWQKDGPWLCKAMMYSIYFGVSCLTRVFSACFRIVWKGFDENSEVERIFGILMRSIALRTERRVEVSC